jgi:deoxyxylulose-5-phosphate synthase
VIGPFVDLASDVLKHFDHPDEIGIMLIRVLKPLSPDGLIRIIENYQHVIIIEENVFSGSVSDEISSYHYDRPVQFHPVTLPDSFIPQDTRASTLKRLGFNRDAILSTIRTFK